MRGLVAALLFLLVTLLIEYLIVSLFISFGLDDVYLFTGLPFALTISPLYHLLPLGVIVVLALSWGYLTENMPRAPSKAGVKKEVSTRSRRQRLRVRKTRLRSTRRFLKELDRGFRRFSRPVWSFYHLHLAKASVKSAVTICGVFLVVVMTLFALGYPHFIHGVTAGFYGANPAFHGFVLGTFETLQSIGELITPLGGLGSAINGALLAMAPSFRTSLEGYGVSITGVLVELDFVWKYAICQNVAAFVSALMALAYRHRLNPRHRLKRR